MPVRAVVFVVLYLAAVVVGRATRLEGTQLALVWPAAGIAFLWLAGAWRPRRERHLALVLLFAATVAGNLLTGASQSLALAFGVANLVQVWVSCAVFARWRPDGWRMAKAEDLRALLVASIAGSVFSAAIGPVAVWALTNGIWPVAPASWVLRNATSTIVVAGVGLRLWEDLRTRRNVLDRGWEFLAVTLLAGGAYLVLFGLTTGVPLAFLVVPLSVGVALRYDTTLAALHGLLVGSTIIALTLAEHGPFALQEPQVRVMLAQAFIGVVSSLTLVLALHRDEREALQNDLAEARDEALEASKLKSAFLANMSHEIRTPMNGVLGMTALLLDTSLDPRQREFATQVRDSAESLLTIIDDILDVSKIEAGKLRFDAVAFSLRDAIGDIQSLLEPQARAKHIALTVEIDDAVPGFVTGDPVRVRQIVTNLVGNAVKFTAAGGVRLHVGPGLEIRVQDTGVGIAPDVLPRLFDPFAQADATTTRRYGGTGLGLAITRQLAELMGGTIAATSEPGRGSTFTVRLPLQAAPPPATIRPVEPRAQDRTHDARPVLLAEDNPVNQIVAAEMLRKRGLAVEIAADGERAVALATAREYAAIFMDCQMPRLDGYEATARLRAHGLKTPIIAMTANAMKGDREQCLAAGMDDYLAKPLRAEELDAALGRWLSREEPLVDPTFLAQLGDPALARTIVEVFIDDAARRLPQLAGNDRAAAHALVGAAASVGALRLAAAARRDPVPHDIQAVFEATVAELTI